MYISLVFKKSLNICKQLLEHFLRIFLRNTYFSRAPKYKFKKKNKFSTNLEMSLINSRNDETLENLPNTYKRINVYVPITDSDQIPTNKIIKRQQIHISKEY